MDNRIISKLFLFGVLFISLGGSAHALDDKSLWFISLEYIGIILGIYVVMVTYNNYKVMREGKIGESSKFMMFAVGLIVLSFVWRAILEATSIEGLFGEIVFEILIYTALVLILISSKKITHIMGMKK